MSPTDRKPSPYDLWHQAGDEFPDNEAARRIRYVALMREHRYLRPTLPGEDPNLPCGWPGKRSEPEEPPDVSWVRFETLSGKPIPPEELA